MMIPPPRSPHTSDQQVLHAVTCEVHYSFQKNTTPHFKRLRPPQAATSRRERLSIMCNGQEL